MVKELKVPKQYSEDYDPMASLDSMDDILSGLEDDDIELEEDLTETFEEKKVSSATYHYDEGLDTVTFIIDVIDGLKFDPKKHEDPMALPNWTLLSDTAIRKLSYSVNLNKDEPLNDEELSIFHNLSENDKHVILSRHLSRVSTGKKELTKADISLIKDYKEILDGGPIKNFENPIVIGKGRIDDDITVRELVVTYSPLVGAAFNNNGPVTSLLLESGYNADENISYDGIEAVLNIVIKAGVWDSANALIDSGQITTEMLSQRDANGKNTIDYLAPQLVNDIENAEKIADKLVKIYPEIAQAEDIPQETSSILGEFLLTKGVMRASGKGEEENQAKKSKKKTKVNSPEGPNS